MKKYQHAGEFEMMQRRIYSVLSTYCTSRWQWRLIALAIVPFILEFFIPHTFEGWELNFQTSTPVGLPKKLANKVFDSPAHATWFANYIEASPELFHGTNRLYIQYYFMMRVGQKIQGATIYVDSNDPPTHNIQEFDRWIVGRENRESHELKAEDLEKLSVVQGIETIEFEGLTPQYIPILKGLRNYPSLRSIVFRFTDPRTLNDQFFEELTSLPHLESLVIEPGTESWRYTYDNEEMMHFYSTEEAVRHTYDNEEMMHAEAVRHYMDHHLKYDFYRPRNYEPAMEGFPHYEILGKSKTLKSLYIGTYGTNMYDELKYARRALPNIHVRPAYSPQLVDIPWLLLLIPLSLLSFLIGNVLNHQYRTHFSQLLPRFQFYHLLIAGFFIVLLVGYSTERMSLRDFNGLMGLVYAATIVSLGVGSQTLDFTKKTDRLRAWGFGVIFVGVVICSFFLTTISVMEQGYYYFLSFFLIAVLISGFSTYHSLRHLAFSNESGVALITGKKFWTKKAEQLQVSNDREKNVRQREQQIEKLMPAIDRLTTRQWVARWRLGNRPNPIRWYMYLLLPIVMTTITNLLMRLFTDESLMKDTYQAQLIAYGILMPLVAVVGAIMFWRDRRFILPSELVRPVKTENVVREWIIGILRDIVPVSVFSALWPAAVTNFSFKDGAMHIDWIWIPGAFITFAMFQTAVSVAMAITAIIVDRIWAWAVLFVALLFAAIAGTIYGFTLLFGPGMPYHNAHEELTWVLSSPSTYYLFILTLVSSLIGITYVIRQWLVDRQILSVMLGVVLCITSYWAFWLILENYGDSYKHFHTSAYKSPADAVMMFANLQLFMFTLSFFYLIVSWIATRIWLRQRNFDYRA